MPASVVANRPAGGEWQGPENDTAGRDKFSVAARDDGSFGTVVEI
jgi:hypothetical protein